MQTKIEIPSKEAGNTRLAQVELLRFVCALGIVWFHLQAPYSWIGHAGLLAFISLSVYFAIEKDQPSWKRTRPLELWIFWSAVYLSMKLAQAYVTNQTLASEFEYWMLLTGPSLPLWFLPFIYVTSGLASTYVRFSRRMTSCNTVQIAEALIMVFLAIASGLLADVVSVIPIKQWLLGLSGVFLAIFFANSRANSILIIFACLISLAMAAAISSKHLSMLFLTLCIVPLALFSSRTWDVGIARDLGAISLGVYLLHPAMISIFLIVFGNTAPIIAFAWVALTSSFLTWILRRWGLLGRMI